MNIWSSKYMETGNYRKNIDLLYTLSYQSIRLQQWSVWNHADSGPELQNGGKQHLCGIAVAARWAGLIISEADA